MARILLSDDHQPSRELYGEGLRRAGHEVWTASDGKAAYHLFLDRKPDLLLTDWHMPRLNGLDLVLTLRRLGHDTPIILLSGGDSYLHGFLHEIAVIRKPVDAGRLARLVQGMIEPDALAPI